MRLRPFLRKNSQPQAPGAPPGALPDVNETGMCYLEIPKIEVSLPTYHTTGADIRKAAVGHIPGSSPPVGGGELPYS